MFFACCINVESSLNTLKHLGGQLRYLNTQLSQHHLRGFILNDIFFKSGHKEKVRTGNQNYFNKRK